MENIKEKLVDVVVERVKEAAEGYAFTHCRYWIGEEKVPQELVELSSRSGVSKP